MLRRRERKRSLNLFLDWQFPLSSKTETQAPLLVHDVFSLNQLTCEHTNYGSMYLRSIMLSI